MSAYPDTQTEDPLASYSLPYATVLEHYRAAKQTPQFADATMADFADQMNKATRSQLYNSGLGGESWIKNASVGINQGIEATGASELSGQLFGGLGSLIGEEEPFRHAGESLPRGVVNMAPTVIGAALAPVTFGGALATGVATSAALAGAGTYEDTGSAGRALLSGGIQAALPGVGSVARSLGLKAAGATLFEKGLSPILGQETEHLVGSTLAQRLAGYGAEQAGLFGVNTAVQAAQGGLNKDSLIESLVGQAAFAPFGASSLFESPVVKTARLNEQLDVMRQLQEATQRAAPPAGAVPFPAEGSSVQNWQAPPQLPWTTPTAELQNPEQYELRSPVMSDGLGEPISSSRGFSWTNPVPPTFGQVPPFEGGDEHVLPPPEPAPLAPAKPIWAQPRALEDVSDEALFKRTAEARNQLILDLPKDESLFGEPKRTPLQPVTAPVPSDINAPPDVDPHADAFEALSRPVTQQVQDAVVGPALAEPDLQLAIRKVRDAYQNVLKPQFGVGDPNLEALSDQWLANTVQSHVANGADLDEATQRTVAAVKQSLADAVQAKKDAFFSQNKLVPLDTMEAAKQRLAEIRAARGGLTFNMFGFGDRYTLEETKLYATLGTGYLEAAVRNGIRITKQWFTDHMLAEHPELKPVMDQWQQAGAQGKSPLDQMFVSAMDTLHGTDVEAQDLQRKSLDDVMPKLQTKAGADPKTSAGKEFATLMSAREQLMNDSRFSGTPKIGDVLLRSVAEYDKTKSQGKTPYKWLEKAALDTRKGELKKTAPEVKYLGTYPTEAEAHARVDEIMRGETDKSATQPFVERSTDPDTKEVGWKVALRRKPTESLDQGFKPEREQESDVETEEPVEEERDRLGRKDLTKSGITVNDDGEVVDLLHEAHEAATDAESALPGSGRQVTKQDSDLLEGLSSRLTSDEMTKRSKVHPWAFAEHAKLFLRALLDNRFSPDKINTEAFIQDAEARARALEADPRTKWMANDVRIAGEGKVQEAAARNIIDKVRSFMLGARNARGIRFGGWLAEQPEMQARIAGVRAQVQTEGSSGKVGKAGVPSAYLRPSIGQALLQSGQALFQRIFRASGKSSEAAELYAASADRFLRTIATFAQAGEARMTGLVGSSDAGVALVSSLDPSWQGIVGLAMRTYSDLPTGTFLQSLTGVHESWHVVQQLYARGQLSAADTYSFEQINDLAGKLNPDQRGDMLMETFRSLVSPELHRAIIRNPEAASSLTNLFHYSSQTTKEFTSTMAGLAAVSLSEKTTAQTNALARISKGLAYGDGAVARFAQLVFKTANELARAVRAAFGSKQGGFVDQMFDAYRAMARTPDEITEAVNKLSTWQQLQPDQFAEALARNVVPDFNERDATLKSGLQSVWARISDPSDETWGSRTRDWIERNLVWFPSLAELRPAQKPVFAESMTYQAKVGNAMEEAFSGFFHRNEANGRLDVGKPIDGFKLVGENEPARNAFNEIVRQGNEKERFLDPTEKQAIYDKFGLPPEARGKLDEFRNAWAYAMSKTGDSMKSFANERVVNYVAAMLMKDGTLPTDMATDAARGLVNAARNPQIPVQPIANVDPTQLQHVMGELPKMLAKVDQIGQMIDQHPEFMSEQRAGRWQVSYSEKQPDGTFKPGGRQAASTREEFKQILATLRDREAKGEVQVGDKYDQSQGTLAQLNPDVIRAFEELEKQAYNSALATLPPEQAAAMHEQYSFGASIEKELSARGLNKLLQPRTMAPGREALDMTQANLNYLSTAVTSMSKQWLRDRAALMQRDPAMVASPEDARIAQDKFDNMLSTVHPIAKRLKEATFFYYLGGNISSMAMNLVQPLQSIPAQLVSDGMSWAQAHGAMISAYKEVTSALQSGHYGDAWVDVMIHRMEANHVLDRGAGAQFFTDPDVNSANLGRLARGEPGFLSSAQAALKPVAYVLNLFKAAYGMTDSLVTRVSAVASLRQARANGLDDQAAYDFAVHRTTLTSPGAGGKAAQSVGFYGGKWIPRSAAAVVGTLQSYVMAMTSQFYRMSLEAVRSGSMTSQASKAFATLVTSQLVCAGALGLPGVGTALGVANKAFPQLQILAHLREALASLFGQDRELGSQFADLAMRGGPTLMGVDLSNRLGLSNLLGVSSYDGFNVSDMLGAPGNVAQNLWKAGQDAMEGRYGLAARDAAPQFVRGIVDLARNDGAVRNPVTQGLQYQPSVGEKVAMAIGLTPTKVGDLREANATAQASDDVKRTQLQVFYSKLSDQLIAKDFGAVRKALVDRAHMDPDFDAASGLKAVVQMAQDKTMPEDPSRGGGRQDMQERARLFATYGKNAGAPNEMQRLMQRVQTERAMGLGGNLTQNDMVQAAMTDALLAKNPNITRAQAQVYIQHQLHGMPRMDYMLGSGQAPAPF